jgi:hypothetical protein
LSLSPATDGAHAAAHLASLRAALRAADLIAGKSAADAAAPIEITEVWAELPPAAQRCYQAHSTRAARAAGQGLELVLSRPVNPAAADTLSEWLRADLERIERIFAAR